jgi:uncharacterized membrane protein YjfL (UPF0719 family)
MHRARGFDSLLSLSVGRWNPFQPALEHSTSCRDIVDYSTVCLSVKLVTLNQIIDILMPSEY